MFVNLPALLAAHGLGASDLVKPTTYVVAGHDGRVVSGARSKHLGAHRPTSTAVYVVQPMDPAWLVEVEAVGARP